MGKYNLNELHIFVIDDDPIFMKILTQFLEKVRMSLPNRIPFVFHYHDNTGDFFDTANPDVHGIMVLDYRLEHEGDNEVSGIDIIIAPTNVDFFATSETTTTTKAVIINLTK